MQTIPFTPADTRGSAARATTIPSSAVVRAIEWVKANRIPGGGIRAHHRSQTVTQEVTGYLIPTLMSVGEKPLALDLARWEASVQRADGSFALEGLPYTFDTAQVARGFLAVLDDLPGLTPNLRRACDYVVRQIDVNGRVGTASLDAWRLADGSVLTDYCNLYVLPPLVEAGRRLGEPRYVEAAARALTYYKNRPDLVVFKAESSTFTHMFGYMMEALVDLGEIELAGKGLEQALHVQRSDGCIPAYPGASWVCSTGIAQISIAWLKAGALGPGRKAVTYLEQLQHPSGGFYGSYGKGAIYFTAEEISWAVKFFIDAELLLRSGQPGGTA